MSITVNCVDGNGDTPLILASWKGHVGVARLLVNKASNNSGNKDATPLLYSSKKGNVDLARLLLENKASLDEANTKHDTPLLYSSEKGNLEVARLLALY